MNYVDVFTTVEFVEHFTSKYKIVNAAVMEAAGYFCVPIDPSGFWEEAHSFLIKRYGKDNYVWTGEKFWFDNEEEALEFYAFYKDWLED